MTNVVRLPARAATAVAAPLQHWRPNHQVDDWGRDAHLISAISPYARLRWRVSVGGQRHLPVRGGALLVTNSRQFSLSSIYTAMALSETLGRPVRFVGRPDIAPIGSFMRRLGGLLEQPEEIAGALRANELVLISAAGTRNPRHAGTVDPALIGAAVTTHSTVFPVASMSSPFGRAARVEVGPAVRARTKRRGPLAEVELAEVVQRHIQHVLDGMGGLQTGVAPLDWLAEG